MNIGEYLPLMMGCTRLPSGGFLTLSFLFFFLFPSISLFLFLYPFLFFFTFSFSPFFSVSLFFQKNCQLPIRNFKPKTRNFPKKTVLSMYNLNQKTPNCESWSWIFYRRKKNAERLSGGNLFIIK